LGEVPAKIVPAGGWAVGWGSGLERCLVKLTLTSLTDFFKSLKIKGLRC